MSKLTPASLGSDDELSDRERLALAFGILREHKWYAPTEWSSTLCCTSCGWERVAAKFGYNEESWQELPYEEEPLSMWWTSESDSVAFYGKLDESPMTADMSRQLTEVWGDGDSPETMSEWIQEHADDIVTDERVARTTEYVNLVADLALQWSGPVDAMRLAVATLRSVGLDVTEPARPTQCIYVHPRETSFRISSREDGRVALWFGYAAMNPRTLPQAVLTQADVQALLASLLLGEVLMESDADSDADEQ
jgi:hypothetical protein